MTEREPVQLLNVKEAAVRLREHPKTVYRLVAAGELTWVNVGQKGKRPKIRFREEDLREYVEARLVPAARQRRRGR